MKYFEIEEMQTDGFTNGFSSICIRGVRAPSIEEAQAFLNKHGDGRFIVKDLWEKDEQEARSEFNFDNEPNWPIFQ